MTTLIEEGWPEQRDDDVYDYQGCRTGRPGVRRRVSRAAGVCCLGGLGRLPGAGRPGRRAAAGWTSPIAAADVATV